MEEISERDTARAKGPSEQGSLRKLSWSLPRTPLEPARCFGRQGTTGRRHDSNTASSCSVAFAKYSPLASFQEVFT